MPCLHSFKNIHFINQRRKKILQVKVQIKKWTKSLFSVTWCTSSQHLVAEAYCFMHCQEKAYSHYSLFSPFFTQYSTFCEISLNTKNAKCKADVLIGKKIVNWHYLHTYVFRFRSKNRHRLLRTFTSNLFYFMYCNYCNECKCDTASTQ